MISKLVYKLVTNILNFKLISFSLLETNLESKILINKTWVTNS